MQATLSVTVRMAGVTATATQTRTQDGVTGITPEASAAHAGNLTTRSSASAGVVTATAHGLVTGDKAVVTWVGQDSNGETVLQHRYNCGCTVSGTAVTLANGAGDDLPAALYPVYIGKQETSLITFDGDDVDTFVVTHNCRGVVAFMDGTNTEKRVIDMDAEGIALWTRDTGFTEPISGTAVTYVLIGSGDTEVFAPKILALYDATSGSGQ